MSFSFLVEILTFKNLGIPIVFILNSLSILHIIFGFYFCFSWASAQSPAQLSLSFYIQLFWRLFHYVFSFRLLRHSFLFYFRLSFFHILIPFSFNCAAYCIFIYFCIFLPHLVSFTRTYMFPNFEHNTADWERGKSAHRNN